MNYVCMWCNKPYIGHKVVYRFGREIPLCLKCRIYNKQEVKRLKRNKEKCLKNVTH